MSMRTSRSGLVRRVRRRSRVEGGRGTIWALVRWRVSDGAVEALDGAAVEGSDEGVVVGGYEIDEVEFEGLGFAE